MEFSQIYKGEGYQTGRPGAILMSMQRQGRDVIKTQRVRWHRNRLMYLGEQYLRIVGSTVRTLAPSDRIPQGRRRDQINRLRQFVDGRVAMLTWKRPPAEVAPDGNDTGDIDAARMATRFVNAMWSEQYWDLDTNFRRLALAGDIDGIAWMQVIYDPTGGKKTQFAIDAETGEPVSDRGKLEALRQADPQGQTLWSPVELNPGEVKFRVVRGGALSIDPTCRERWGDARWIIESRVVSRTIVEREANKTVKDLLREQGEIRGAGAGNDPYPAQDYGQIQIEDTEGQEGFRASRDNVIVHEMFVMESSDWPQGAHMKWIDQAPDKPYLVEPWGDELPYYPYTPRPDGGHVLRSRGCVDDLVPVQVRFNRTLSQIGEWLDRVARPPLVLTGGGLRAETPRVFNELGYVITNPGFAPPQFMTVPGEPTNILTNHLQFLLDQMAEIALQNDATRGEAPVNQDSAAGLNTLIQQQEQQISGTAAELVKTMQWAVSRALKLVVDNYDIPRWIQSPSIYDSSEFRAFVGSRIKGATRFRITASLLPKSQAAQAQQFMQIMQASQGKLDFTPYLAAIVEGNMDELVEGERRQEQRQKRENDKIAQIELLGKAKLDDLWNDYIELLTKWQQAMVRVENQAMGQGMTPEQLGMMQGLKKPTIEDVGVPVPKVEEFDRDGEHLSELDSFCSGEAFENYHSVTRAAASRHREMHVEKMAQSFQAGPAAPVDDKGGAAPNRQKPDQAPDQGVNQ